MYGWIGTVTCCDDDVERLLEDMWRKVVGLNNVQFALMPGK